MGEDLINYIYFNPENAQCYIIDCRIFDKDGDGKSKHDHAQDMLLGIVEEKKLQFRTVLIMYNESLEWTLFVLFLILLCSSISRSTPKRLCCQRHSCD